ncbi:hypothetical protein GVY41_19890 [Frigidibacter albus]|uniref:Uncharacterized protein n=1 Tax=Frigidibacter albus TaxID=1465486 RepID=A0A6L8VMQ5_9RHOB|nr:hypothetical protein [Frigidibacter albus]MZQ91334.1 hypothetical protein [Frigidibacter albus]NBE33256.1 hypothetical protein [Frigidibacter albus]GGH52889.1 hypothetical protein GCM10011341_17820 [Frigidibacter albus]
MARKRNTSSKEKPATALVATPAAAPVTPGQVSSGAPLAEWPAAPHPSLIALVRLLARQAAQAEVAAQIAAQLPED